MKRETTFCICRAYSATLAGNGTYWRRRYVDSMDYHDGGVGTAVNKNINVI